MSDELTGGKAYIPSMTWAAAAEELQRLASSFSADRKRHDADEFMFRIISVQKARNPKPPIPMHINLNMKTIEQEQTQAILSAFDQLEAMTAKCDKLEYERDLWKEEAERWRKLARDPNILSRGE